MLSIDLDYNPIIWYRLYWPVIFLLITCVVIILLSLFRAPKNLIFGVAIAGIAFNLLVSPTGYWVSDLLPYPREIVDSFGDIIKIISGFAALITVMISGPRQRMEYFLMILSILIGAEILMISTSFIMIVLSMELISISSYVLVAGTEASKQRAEAAWKFFLFGSVATAVMIFGMTYIYGASGRTEIAGAIGDNPLVQLGGIMMLGGFLFKMTGAPFHLWAPDVYEAAPAPVVAFLSVVPKLAALTIIVHWISFTEWQNVVAIFAIVTIVVGTLAAINQSNSKRMMAYSSVAQAGFLLIPLVSLAQSDLSFPYSPIVFYAVVFAVMNYAVFIVIHEQEKSGQRTAFTNFSAIGYSNPLAAVAITLGLISLAGIPPVAGFMAKLFIFTKLWVKYADSGNVIFLVLFTIGLLATVASLFFYLKIPFYAFFRRSEEDSPLKISLPTNLLLIILVGILLVLFVAPGLLMG